MAALVPIAADRADALSALAHPANGATSKSHARSHPREAEMRGPVAATAVDTATASATCASASRSCGACAAARSTPPTTSAAKKGSSEALPAPIQAPRAPRPHLSHPRRSSLRARKRASPSAGVKRSPRTTRERAVRARADDRNRGRKRAQTGSRGRTSLDRPERGRADPSPTGTSIRACAPCERTTGRLCPPGATTNRLAFYMGCRANRRKGHVSCDTHEDSNADSRMQASSCLSSNRRSCSARGHAGPLERRCRGRAARGGCGRRRRRLRGVASVASGGGRRGRVRPVPPAESTTTGDGGRPDRVDRHRAAV